MENTKYGMEGRWTPIRAKAQDTKANPNSWETHLVRKRWDIGLLLRALGLWIMITMMMMNNYCEGLGLNCKLHYCSNKAKLDDDDVFVVVDDDDDFYYYYYFCLT